LRYASGVAYKVKVYGSGKSKKNPVLEVYGQGQDHANPLELSPVALVAIIGVTAVAAGFLVYLMTRATTQSVAALPEVPTPTPPAQPTGLGSLPPGGAIPGDSLAAKYMYTVERLLQAG
jgi:hypothetical protein